MNTAERLYERLTRRSDGTETTYARVGLFVTLSMLTIVFPVAGIVALFGNGELAIGILLVGAFITLGVALPAGGLALICLSILAWRIALGKDI